MSASIKLVDKLEGVENFRAWKYRIGLILEKNDLARFIKNEVPRTRRCRRKDKASKGHNKGQKNHCRFNQGPSDPLCVIQEDPERNV
jgi:hypothetical protein